MTQKVYQKQIGLLSRKITLGIFEWGVRAVVADKSVGDINTKFDTRNFKICNTFPTIEDCEKRVLKYYNIDVKN